MTLIEGFGDEVIGIFAVIMIALLTCVVWVSTSVADRPRASVLVSTRTADGSLIIQEGVLNDAIEEAMDTRMSGPRRFNSTDVEPPDDAGSGAHQGETSSAAGAGEVGGDDAVLETDEEIRAHPDAIRVKLKYVNDSDKSVDGRLGEKLAEFKRRNFRPDLAAGKFVRLIFQGRMLTNEEETLAQHGLFDNCVVHCHVSNNHPRQSAGPQLDPNQTHHPAAFHHFNDAAILAQGEFEIELGNWMMPIAGFLLSILWSYWYQFGHFFSFLATVCLTVLTGLFFTVLLGIYSNVWSTPNNAPADQRPEERNNNAILVGLWNLNIPLPNFMSFLVGNPAAPAH